MADISTIMRKDITTRIVNVDMDRIPTTYSCTLLILTSQLRIRSGGYLWSWYSETICAESA